MPSNHLILCRPLLLPPSIFPSIRVFSNESALHIRWPKYWSFSLNISPSNEHPGLISFRMDWLDLLAAQGTLKSLLQHLSSKASILWHSAFFIVQLPHPYMTTGEKKQDRDSLLSISSYFMGWEKNSVLSAISKKTLVLSLSSTNNFVPGNKVDGCGSRAGQKSQTILNSSLILFSL